jgi:hypothetical protein
MRVFLDANILFLAALPQSRMRAFLDVLLDRAECLTNDYVGKFWGRTIQGVKIVSPRLLVEELRLT